MEAQWIFEENQFPVCSKDSNLSYAFSVRNSANVSDVTQLLKQRSCQSKVPGNVPAIPELLSNLFQLLPDDFKTELRGHDAPVGKLRAVSDPLPQLRPADFRSRGVLHQVVDRNASPAPEPRFNVLDPDRNIGPQAVFSYRALVDFQQISRSDTDIVPQIGELVWSLHPSVEHFLREHD